MSNQNHDQQLRLCVAQLGARRHYAIPRMLHKAGMLEHFYTDICAVKGWPKLLQWVPKSLRSTKVQRLLGRVPYDVPSHHITAFSKFGWEYTQKRNTACSPSEITAVHLWAGKRFCELVLQQGLGSASGVYTFNGAGLELLQTARGTGLKTIMEQTGAPPDIERSLMSVEQATFPSWEQPLVYDDNAEQFIQRQRSEWEQADIILVPSQFVLECMQQVGGPVNRCVVVPYGVDTRFQMLERPKHNGPLRVLTVGSVRLQKGSQYILEVAKKLRGKAIFRMVGSIGVLPKIVDELRTSVELMGPIPRSEIFSQFAWADVFLLPSLCEGSATVVYEALAAGLPVICTPNTGSVVRNGVEGFIVPIRNDEAIVEKIEILASNPNLLAEMSHHARQRAGEFTLKAYNHRLVQTLTHHFQ